MDLYCGLEESGRLEEIERLRAELDACRKSEKALQAEVTETKAQVVTLNDDLRVLEDNMTTLFNTALLEVSRKDREIEALRLEIIELKTRNTTLSDRMQELEGLVRRHSESH